MIYKRMSNIHAREERILISEATSKLNDDNEQVVSRWTETK